MLTNVINGLLCCQMQWTFSVIFFSLSTGQPSEADEIASSFPSLLVPLAGSSFFTLILSDEVP